MANMKVILPKMIILPENLHKPLFFMLGPIQGGGDWQYQACMILKEKITSNVSWVNNFCVANPYRYPPGHDIWAYAPQTTKNFDRQLAWEREYLSLAASLGCIIAWLPAESKTNPRSDGQPYGRDTMGELGEWRGRMMPVPSAICKSEYHFILGGEEGFPGFDMIKRNFNHALGYSKWEWGGIYPTYATLEKTVEAAVQATLIEPYKYSY